MVKDQRARVEMVLVALERAQELYLDLLEAQELAQKLAQELYLELDLLERPQDLAQELYLDLDPLELAQVMVEVKAGRSREQ